MSVVHPNNDRARLWLMLQDADISMDVTTPTNVAIYLHDEADPSVLASDVPGTELAQLFIDAINAFREGERPPCRWYVTIYEEDQAYGGPEEGGWYYPIGVPTTEFALSFETKQNAIDYADFLLAKILPGMNEGRPEISSVLSRGRFNVVVETEPPQAYPTRKPRYE